MMTARNARLGVGLLTTLLALAHGGLAQARTGPPCTPITRDQVAALFNRWNASLATGDPDAVVKNYSPDALLLPTAENGPLVGPAIRGYFVHFLERHPHGAIDQRWIIIGCNIAYDAGTYTFALDGPTHGSRVELHARYTYIYEPRGGKWLIVHHHSSADPKP
jgi:uncharacterized protein (TIGR02246 family)